MNEIKILGQTPIILHDFKDSLEPTESDSEFIPCIGLTLCYGIAISNKDATLKIEQGIDESAPLEYIDSEVFTLSPNVPIKYFVDIVGKFIRITVTNNGTSSATIKSFSQCRGSE